MCQIWAKFEKLFRWGMLGRGALTFPTWKKACSGRNFLIWIFETCVWQLVEGLFKISEKIFGWEVRDPSLTFPTSHISASEYYFSILFWFGITLGHCKPILIPRNTNESIHNLLDVIKSSFGHCEIVSFYKNTIKYF